MKRDSSFELEYEYIDFIKSIANCGVTSLYGIDQKRVALHKQLLKHHGYDAENPDIYQKSKIIMENLDDAIDYDERQPKCTPHEALRLNHWLSCVEFRGYMEGKIMRIKLGGRYLPTE